MAINGCSSAEVTAVPITSVMMPIITSTISESSATSSPADSTNRLVTKDITTERPKDRQTTVNIHFCLLCLAFSFLLTKTSLRNTLSYLHFKKAHEHAWAFQTT